MSTTRTVVDEDDGGTDEWIGEEPAVEDDEVSTTVGGPLVTVVCWWMYSSKDEPSLDLFLLCTFFKRSISSLLFSLARQTSRIIPYHY